MTKDKVFYKKDYSNNNNKAKINLLTQVKLITEI